MTSLMRLGCLSVALISTPVMAQQPVWGTFNGDLKAQKYSPLNDITPANVATLRRAWQRAQAMWRPAQQRPPPRTCMATPERDRRSRDGVVGNAVVRQ